MRKFLLIGLLALSACGMSDAQRVFTAKTALDGATLAAVHYAQDLPRCSAIQAPPCSRQDLIDRANIAAHRAKEALDDAEALVRKRDAAKANPMAGPAPADGTVSAQARLAAASVKEVQQIVEQMSEGR